MQNGRPWAAISACSQLAQDDAVRNPEHAQQARMGKDLPFESGGEEHCGD
jgi:hypothetical protein